jgi:hypothetical protein
LEGPNVLHHKFTLIKHGVLDFLQQIPAEIITKRYVEVMEKLLYTLTPFQMLHDISVNGEGRWFRSIINTDLFDKTLIQRTVANLGNESLRLISTGMHNKHVDIEKMIQPLLDIPYYFKADDLEKASKCIEPIVKRLTKCRLDKDR